MKKMAALGKKLDGRRRLAEMVEKEESESE